MLPPPPLADLALGEVQIPLPLLIRGRLPCPGCRARVSRVQQILPPLRLLKERRIRVEHGIVVRDDVEVLPAKFGEELLRLRQQRRFTLEMPDTPIPAQGVAVRREKNERIARQVLLSDRVRQPLQFVPV